MSANIGYNSDIGWCWWPDDNDYRWGTCPSCT